MILKNIVKWYIGALYCKINKINVNGKCIYIGMKTKFINGKNIFLSEHVSIRPDCYISCNYDANLCIGENSDIGCRSRIIAGSKIKISKNVLMGPNVYISDIDHRYDLVDIAIKDQGTRQKCNSAILNQKGIFIGRGSWIGINAVIVGNVYIGKGCVIGANTVVTKDIPDYSVVVGTPGKIVKYYDKKSNKWIYV